MQIASRFPQLPRDLVAGCHDHALCADRHVTMRIERHPFGVSPDVSHFRSVVHACAAVGGLTEDRVRQPIRIDLAAPRLRIAARCPKPYVAAISF